MKSKSLQDLDAMRKKLADIAKAQKLAEQARIAAEKRAEAERNLFTRAVGKVAPIAIVGGAKAVTTRKRYTPN